MFACPLPLDACAELFGVCLLVLLFVVCCLVFRVLDSCFLFLVFCMCLVDCCFSVPRLLFGCRVFPVCSFSVGVMFVFFAVRP